MNTGNFLKQENKDAADNLERKVSTLLIYLGLIVLSMNIISGIIRKFRIIDMIYHPSINTIFLGVIVLVLCRFIFKRFEKTIHILILLMVSFFGIMADYNNFYGIGQIILALILMYKYGFLNRKIILKLIFFFLRWSNFLSKYSKLIFIIS